MRLRLELPDDVVLTNEEARSWQAVAASEEARIWRVPDFWTSIPLLGCLIAFFVRWSNASCLDRARRAMERALEAEKNAEPFWAARELLAGRILPALERYHSHLSEAVQILCLLSRQSGIALAAQSNLIELGGSEDQAPNRAAIWKIWRSAGKFMSLPLIQERVEHVLGLAGTCKAAIQALYSNLSPVEKQRLTGHRGENEHNPLYPGCLPE